MIAADNGNLKLDTGTLGFSDIAGKDKEHGYYLNAGGTWSSGGGAAQQDASQVGKGDQGSNGWSVSGWKYDKDREQIVRATVGQGDIVVRGDAGSEKDSTAGLNRDLDKAYEITRDKESRTDLYVTDSSLHDALNPKETLQNWSDGLLNYDKTALKNFEQASVGVSATLNRLERVMGRELAAGVTSVTSRDFAEQTLEQLILGGKSRADAMAMMADEKFQQNVLGELSRFWNIKPETIAQAKEIVEQATQQVGGENVLHLPASDVSAKKLTLLQDNLRSLSSINDFIEQNQDRAQAIGMVLALTQGPKGVIQAVAMSAAEQTPLGQALMERLHGMQEYVGQKIAEHMEGQGLTREDDFDRYLMGGGNLIASVIGTGISSIKGVRIDKGNTPRDVAVRPGKDDHDGVIGGAHRDTSKPVNDGLDSHHCPAKHCYSSAPISSMDGPAIKMDPADHRLTASYGSSPEAKAYRAKQEGLLQEGRLKDAIQMDVDDIRSRFGSKYDAAIEQMLTYANTLDPNDFIKR